MPHVIVKLVSGRSEAQKTKLAEALTAAVMTHAGCSEDAVSVSIQDIAADDWTGKVYEPDIAGKADTLYKKPGYTPV